MTGRCAAGRAPSAPSGGPERAGPVPSAEPREHPRPETAAQPDRHRVVGSAFDNAPIGIAVLTPPGIIIMCNAAMGALLGRSPSDLVGAPFFTLTHLDDIAARGVAASCCGATGAGSRVWSARSCVGTGPLCGLR